MLELITLGQVQHRVRKKSCDYVTPPPSFLCVRSNQWEEAFLSKWLTSIAALLFLLHHQSASYRTVATSSLESLRCSRRSSAGVQPRQHLVSKRRAQQGVRSATSHDRDLTYYPNHVWQVAKGRSGERGSEGGSVPTDEKGTSDTSPGIRRLDRCRSSSLL